jgi:hypothetical protein
LSAHYFFPVITPLAGGVAVSRKGNSIANNAAGKRVESFITLSPVIEAAKLVAFTAGRLRIQEKFRQGKEVFMSQ